MIRLSHRRCKTSSSLRHNTSSSLRHKTSSPFIGRNEYRTKNNQRQIDQRISNMIALAISSCARPWTPIVEDEVLAGKQMPENARHKSTAKFYCQTAGNVSNVSTKTNVKYDWNVEDVETDEHETLIADRLIT